MYKYLAAVSFVARKAPFASIVALAAALPAGSCSSLFADGPLYQPSIVRKISSTSEKLELTTNTSRILTLDKKIPRVQVNNPDLLAVTPLSANQVQVSAKKAGVTQINLWDEEETIHTVDVIVYGDAKELEHALRTQFPHSSLSVYRYSESLVVKGFVDRPDYVSQIMRLAEDYAPKVINNINVGGVQQILLRVKVMEISRTKLRRLGVDWAQVSQGGGFVASSVSGIIDNVIINNGATTIRDTGASTFQFGIVDGADAFFGYLDALEQNNIAKILAEPNLTAVSGRPAQFNAGGEIPILVPQSLGTASIEFKKFGTQVDFLPIVLGNGNIRLEVRPRISEIDDSRSVVIQNFTIPALTVREVDTAVEMQAGQTFALAGLIQERSETQRRGLPWLSNIPVLGVPFRRIEDEVNEIELLILVTPEFVDAIEPHEVPCGGPGWQTVSPNDCGLYVGGHVEVPSYCEPTRGLPACGMDNCQNGCDGSGPTASTGPAYGFPTSPTYQGGPVYGEGSQPSPEPLVPGEETYDATGPVGPLFPTNAPAVVQPLPSSSTDADDYSYPVHGELTLPPQANGTAPTGPRMTAPQGGVPTPEATAPTEPVSPAAGELPAPPSASRPFLPQRQHQFQRHAQNPQYRPQAPSAPPAAAARPGDLFGPVGYDVR